MPKSAGFLWDKTAKQWWTADHKRAAQLLKFADSLHRPQLEPLALARSAALHASRAVDADVEIPCNPGLAYLPYQRAGIAFTLQRDATLLGDEMGLGKTIQALGVINATPAIERILVLCPSSLKLNWKREAEKWLVRKPSIGVVSGDWFPLSCGIVICNYDVLSRHAKKIRSVTWDLLIADEAHYLKNPKAKRTIMVFGDDRETSPIMADRRILMTGTPIVNRPVELWPLLHYLDPGTWGNFYRFANRYCDPKREKVGKRNFARLNGASNLSELQESLRSTILIRRLKRDVLTELPPKRRQIIAVDRPDMAEALAHEKQTWEAGRSAVSKARAMVARCDPTSNPREYERAVADLKRAESIAFAEISKERHRLAIAKLPDLLAHIETAIDSAPTVCFVHHKDLAEAMRERFGKACVTLTGDHNIQERQRSVDRFQTDESARLFIGTIMAAGVGLTLTRSSHVVFGELDWVPGNLTQAEDRCHRIGQTDSVLVQHVVIDGSLDQRMAEILVSKQGVIDAALDTPPDFDPWEGNPYEMPSL